MGSTYSHQFFESPQRVSQSLCNDRCQNILFKAVFEHFVKLKWIAALLLASKSFQNSSFGANFLVNFAVEENTIVLIESVLAPSSCFSLQFVPSLLIKQLWLFDNISPRISNFLGELVNTKYLRPSLRSLMLDSVDAEVVAFFFGSSSNDSWPHLQDLSLKHCELNDGALEIISKTALQLRTLDLSYNSTIIDSSLEQLSNFSCVTSLDLSGCKRITDAGLEHVAKLSNITSLNFSFGKTITDVALEHISKLFNLTSLNLSSCDELTDAGLEHVAKLSRLTSLDLASCKQITNTGLGHVSKLSSITWLKLFGCGQITDGGLEHLSKLSGITDLSLTFCDKITDAGLQRLSGLSGLTSLDLTFCRITNEAKSKLKTVLPNCTIINDE